MKLLPEELRRHLPPLYSQENTEDPTVHAKFFTPDSNWTWFATEGSQDEDDFRFFGYVIGLRRNGGTSCLQQSPENVNESRDIHDRYLSRMDAVIRILPSAGALSSAVTLRSPSVFANQVARSTSHVTRHP